MEDIGDHKGDNLSQGPVGQRFKMTGAKTGGRTHTPRVDTLACQPFLLSLRSSRLAAQFESLDHVLETDVPGVLDV